MATRPEFADTLAYPTEMQALNGELFPRLARLAGPTEIQAASAGALNVPFLALPGAILAHYDDLIADMRIPMGFAPTVLQKKGKVEGFQRDVFQVFVQSVVESWYATDAGWHMVSEAL